MLLLALHSCSASLTARLHLASGSSNLKDTHAEVSPATPEVSSSPHTLHKTCDFTLSSQSLFVPPAVATELAYAARRSHLSM